MIRFKNSMSGQIRGIVIFLLVSLFGILIIDKYVSAPDNFPSQSIFVIEKGDSLSEIANNLSSQNYIKSPTTFKILMKLIANERTITEGEFYFDKPRSAFFLASRIAGRDFGVLQYRVTFPEGYTNKEMGDRLSQTFPNFDKEKFLLLGKSDIGYLFPDTYSFSPSVTPEEVIDALKQNFNSKISSLESDFAKSKRTKKDIIIMASIIEKEARGNEDAGVISGILWKRIDRGIALQVDAPFLYLLGKKSSDLTLKDLAIKSPYNTYINRGLTPTPISNPGLTAIKAALNPVESPYLFYLHDDQGIARYAKNFDEHRANIQKYLK